MALHENGLPPKLDAYADILYLIEFPTHIQKKTWIYLDIAPILRQWAVKIDTKPLLKR